MQMSVKCLTQKTLRIVSLAIINTTFVFISIQHHPIINKLIVACDETWPQSIITYKICYLPSCSVLGNVTRYRYIRQIDEVSIDRLTDLAVYRCMHTIIWSII